MRNYYKSLAPISIIIILSFLLLTLSCSEDPSSPKKEEPIDAVTIGLEGGIIEKEDLSITIPPGSFDGNYDISVSDIEDDAFTGNSFLNSYKIKGVPNNFSKAITIKFTHNQQINDDVFIAVGSIWKNEIIEDSSIIYQVNPANDSSGFLIGSIPTINDISNNFLSKNNFWAHPVSFIVSPLLGYETLKTENFELKIPYSISEKKNQIGELLEDSYKIAKDTLQLPFNNNLNLWKVAIKIQNESVSGGGNLLNISRNLVSSNDYNNIKIALGKKFVELGLWNIIRGHKLIHDDNIAHPGFFTLLTAIQTWSEELFTTDQNFKYPLNFLPNYLAPFNGLRKGSGSILSLPLDYRHGYGLSSLIKYLVEDNRFGKLGLIKTFDKIGQRQYPITAIMNTFDGSFVDWFPDFFKEYLSDDIYDIPTNYFVNDAHQVWDVNGASDTLKLFAAKDIGLYPDLSAKLFMVKLNYQPPDDTYNMLISMKGPVTEFGLSLVVFGIQNNNFSYLETVHAQDFIIPNLKEYYDAEITQFLIVLVNGLGIEPYLSETDIDLSIKINNNSEGEGGIGEFDYNFCELQLLVNKFYEREDGTTFEQEYIQPLSVDGETIGNRFVTKSEFYVFADTLEVVLSEDGDSILLLDWTHWYRTDSPSSTQKTVIEAIGIPVYDSNNGIFKVSGIQTCGNVTHYSYNQNFQGNETTVTSINCNENSFLEIRLYKRE